MLSRKTRNSPKISIAAKLLFCNSFQDTTHEYLEDPVEHPQPEDRGVMANKPTYEELEQRVEDLERVDMTPKRMEDALRKSEKHYRILIETIPHGIQEIDTSGTLTFVNDAYCRLMGYQEREVLGKTIEVAPIGWTGGGDL